MLGAEDLDVLRLHVFQAINDGAASLANVFSAAVSDLVDVVIRQ